MSTPEEGELVYRVKRVNERYHIGVPTAIGAKLEASGQLFELQLGDEGLVYRPVAPFEGLPEWLSKIVTDDADPSDEG